MVEVAFRMPEPTCPPRSPVLAWGDETPSPSSSPGRTSPALGRSLLRGLVKTCASAVRRCDSEVEAMTDTVSTACGSTSDTRVSSRRDSLAEVGAFDRSLAIRRQLEYALKASGLRGPGGTRPRFSRQALAQFWEEIGADTSGVVTQKEVAVALKESSDVRAVMYLLTKFPLRPVLELPARGEKHKELREMKEIFREVAWNRDGNLDWAGFVNTFKQHGMLVD